MSRQHLRWGLLLLPVLVLSLALAQHSDINYNAEVFRGGEAPSLLTRHFNERESALDRPATGSEIARSALPHGSPRKLLSHGTIEDAGLDEGITAEEEMQMNAADVDNLKHARAMSLLQMADAPDDETVHDLDMGEEMQAGNDTASNATDSTCCACPAVAGAADSSGNSSSSDDSSTNSSLGDDTTGNDTGNASDGNATAVVACCACHPSKQVTMTFAMDKPADEAALTTFQTAFKSEMAAGLGIDASRITFPAPAPAPAEAESDRDLGESAGVDDSKYAFSFSIAPGAANENTTELVNTLAAQVSNPTSGLSMGQIMSQLDKSAGMAVGSVTEESTCQTLAKKWGYKDAPADNGPEAWKTKYPKCGMAAQSPVRLPIKPPAKASTVFKRLDFDYKSSQVTLMNDGRVLMAMVTPGSTFRLSGEEASAATLQYAIFHSPSEHVFTDANGNDIRYAAELQLHHRTAAGLITVVSVLFKVNAPSPFIDKLFGKIPKSCESTQTELPVKFEDALPFSRTYYEYTGSLTSPPCTDSVTWYVLREQSTISLEQIEKLRETFGLDMKKAPTPVASASPHEISVLDKDAFPDYTFSEKLMGNVRPLQDLGDRPLAATPSSL